MVLTENRMLAHLSLHQGRLVEVVIDVSVNHLWREPGRNVRYEAYAVQRESNQDKCCTDLDMVLEVERLVSLKRSDGLVSRAERRSVDCSQKLRS